MDEICLNFVQIVMVTFLDCSQKEFYFGLRLTAETGWSSRLIPLLFFFRIVEKHGIILFFSFFSFFFFGYGKLYDLESIKTKKKKYTCNTTNGHQMPKKRTDFYDIWHVLT